MANQSNVPKSMAELEAALVRLRTQLDELNARLQTEPKNISLVIQRVNVMKLIMLAQSEIDRRRSSP